MASSSDIPGFLYECRPTILVSVACSVAVSLGYVCMLYLPFNAGDRNRPRTIASRQMSSFVLAVVCETVIRLSVARRASPIANAPVSLRNYTGATATTVTLTLLLYTGDLLARFDSRDLFPHLFSELQTKQQRWISLRNYLASPFFEEVIFRQQALVIWQCAPTTLRVIGPAILFGAAHLHHAATVGLVPALFQFAYTSLFGMYAALLLLNSGTVVAPVVAHMTCNYLGIPDFEAIRRHKWVGAISAVYAAALVTFVLGLWNSALLYASIYDH